MRVGRIMKEGEKGLIRMLSILGRPTGENSDVSCSKKWQDKLVLRSKGEVPWGHDEGKVKALMRAQEGREVRH